MSTPFSAAHAAGAELAPAAAALAIDVRNLRFASNAQSQDAVVVVRWMADGQRKSVMTASR